MNNEILLNCSLTEKLSKKGLSYKCLEIQLTPTYTKQVFLEPSELEVVNLYYKKEDKKENK